MDSVIFKNVSKIFQTSYYSTDTSNSKMFSRKEKYVKTNKVIDDISFVIPQGQCVGIIGRNGSGKSTLLSLIAKILVPDSGEIITNGRIASVLELGMGFHQDLSGRENIYLKGELYGFSKKEMDLRIDEIIEYSGLLDYIDLPIRTYSSGMVGRLAFSILVHLDADIMILDEILSVGDSNFSLKASEYFKKCIRENKTVIIVSHSSKTIESLCSRAIWIDHGKIVADGASSTVCSKYEYEMNNSPEVFEELANFGVPLYQYKFAKQQLINNSNKYTEGIIRLLKESADSGYAPAQVAYGDYLISVKDEKAQNYYEMASEMGNLEARRKLCSLIAEEEVDEDRHELFSYLEYFSNQGHPRDIYRYAVAIYHNVWNEDDRKHSFELFKKSADLGYVEAQYQVGLMLKDGVGVAKNVAESIKYLKMAAASGHLESQVNLADAYHEGRIVEKNDGVSVQWYKRAAEIGHAKSQYQLAIMYRDGIGVTRNEELAKHWFKCYAHSTIAPYQIMLAEQMKNSTKDFGKLPLKLYEKAAQSGNYNAILQLAIMYRDGIYTLPNMKKAIEYFELACCNSQGPFNALADIYYRGTSVPPDIEKAIYFYKKSAMSGDASALLKMAYLTKEGLNSKDNLDYLTYLKYSAERGNREAFKEINNKCE